MATLTDDAIKKELSTKGYSLIDASNYKNLNSLITVKCPEGHVFETTMNYFRKASFTCPICDKSIDFKNPINVPQKQGYRIIAFDQATEKFGLSIYDNGQLSFYKLLTFNGTAINRITKIRKFIQEIVINQWQPDIIIMEDIQYQRNGILTFKILAMLLGVIQEVCCENNIDFDVVAPNVWRKYAGTCGKTRSEEKILTIAKVKEKYNIKVTDDVAEAILIGYYGSIMHKSVAFGKKES